MANMKIIDLSTGSPDSTSYIESTQANSQAPGGRVTIKVNLAELGNWIAGQGNSPLGYQDLNTDSDTLIDAINELLVYAMNIAAEYDPTATYAVGDFCIYQGVLYKCTTAIAVAEAWNSAHWTSTLIVDEFGTGGGASVTLGTTVPSDASGENGDLYVQYDSSTYAVVEYFVKINNSWRKAPYSRVVALTQSEYSQITPDPTTLYIITDAQSSYQTKSDNSLGTTDKTVVGAINSLIPNITTISTISDTVNSSTDKDIYTVNLNKGTYIFNGSTLWKTSGTAQGLTMIALLGTDTITQNLEYTVGWCVENLTAIFNVPSDNTSFTIRLYQTTGSNVAVDFSGNLTRISQG